MGRRNFKRKPLQAERGGDKGGPRGVRRAPAAEGKKEQPPMPAKDQKYVEAVKGILNDQRYNPRLSSMLSSDLAYVLGEMHPEKFPDKLAWGAFITKVPESEVLVFKGPQRKHRVCLPGVKHMEEKDQKVDQAAVTLMAKLYNTVQRRGPIALSDFFERQRTRKEAAAAVFRTTSFHLWLRRENCFTLKTSGPSPAVEDCVVGLAPRGHVPEFLQASNELAIGKGLQRTAAAGGQVPRALRVSLFRLKKLAGREEGVLSKRSLHRRKGR